MLYVSDVIKLCNGTLLCGSSDIVLESFSKDTRTIKEGEVYVGIKGASFDGNKFFSDAIEKGASVCILDNTEYIDDISLYNDVTIVKVDDTISCIGKLAKYKRSLYDIPVIAVTGSVGKTSTKDLITSVLKEKYSVLSTIGNNNNNIGLPLTILRYKDEDVMVIEMGMNNFGEISYLSDITSPTIGVITNVGTAHIGNLGSRENIMKAKLEILDGLNGSLIINNDNDIMHDNLDYIKSLGNIITFGIDNNSDYMASNIDGNKFYVGDLCLESPIDNRAFIYNSLLAYIVGKLCNVDDSDIISGIKNLNLTSNRLEYKKMKNGAILIDDSYNASLDSIKASLEILRKEKCKRRIAVIGDVLELGDYSCELHREIGKELFDSNLDYIVTIGEGTKNSDEYLKENGYVNYKHFENERDSYDFLESFLVEGDTVLFKGSHSMNLSNIVKHLMDI